MATIVGVFALVLALLALAYAWRLHQELERARTRLDRYNRSMFAAEESIRALKQQVEDTAAILRLHGAAPNGALRLTKDTSVRIAQMANPQLEQALQPLLASGCQSCGNDADLTIAELSQNLGVDAEVLIEGLERAANNQTPGDSAPAPFRAPNIRLELEL